MKSSSVPLKFRRHSPVAFAYEAMLAASHIPDVVRGTRLGQRSESASSVELLHVALDDAREHGFLSDEFVFKRTVRAGGDTTIGLLEHADETSRIFVKIARSEAGAARLAHEYEFLRAAHRDARLARIHGFLPRALGAGGADDTPYTVESGIAGRQLDTFANTQHWLSVAGAAYDILREVQSATGTVRELGAHDLDEVVHEPLRNVLAMMNEWHETSQQYIEHLRYRLTDELLGREASFGLLHGDFGATNILGDAESGELRGVVDWEASRLDGIDVLDLGALLIDATCRVNAMRLDESVIALYGGEVPSAVQKIYAKYCESVTYEPFPLATIVLLRWLHHVASETQKSSAYAAHRIWRYRTVARVLFSFDIATPKKSVNH